MFDGLLLVLKLTMVINTISTPFLLTTTLATGRPLARLSGTSWNPAQRMPSTLPIFETLHMFETC